jgi:hypothetical protein
MLITIAIGFLSRVVDKERAPWLVVIWIGANIVSTWAFGDSIKDSIVTLMAQAVLIYIYLRLLYRAADTIAINLAILIAGAFLISLVSIPQ